MIKRILAILPVLLFVTYLQAQQKPLSAGMKIRESITIKKGLYQLTAPAGRDAALIIIEGNDITVDFNNAVLSGSANLKTPDRFAGLAILVRNGRNITIKNLAAKGYKVVLQASGVENLTIEHCDFSYNYRPRLNSTQEKEDVSDWMSYHHNEKDEWLRYGAAIYLRGCDGAMIRNNKVTGGQNALMMMECNDGTIINNDFSFNSGIGIGMYRSSRNNVMYNKLIFNVRGYSHGVYNRGQDSAGILLYEQSSGNVFYRNNVTHGGDGFFLWAGQSTMDSGQGGCNDNKLIANDFSYAPTNGIEVTFSRNEISGNRIFECDHGIWGGYSYMTEISNNQFRQNRIAIAIEHGQYNQINRNLFNQDKEAIRLWARKEQPADWAYARQRDTRSVGYAIVSNSFNNNPIVFNVSRTDSLNIFDNTYSESTGDIFKMDSTVTNLDTIYNARWDVNLAAPKEFVPPAVGEAADPFTGTGKYAGRKNIRITEWGPYDFRYPLLWHTNPADKSDTLKFELLGPKGKWVIKNIRGVKNLSATRGVFPATITALKIKGKRTDIQLGAEYTGESFTTAFGEKIAAGKPYSFSFKKFFQPLDWEVLFYSMDTANYNPVRETGLFPPNVRMAPLKTEKKDRLEYAWWGGIREGETVYKQFITVATTKASFPAGLYELSVTWDDAVRVYLDGKLVLDEWNPARHSFDESPNRKIRVNLNGNHSFRVEHLELGGFATLALKLSPVR